MKLTSLLRNSIFSFLLVASLIFTNSGCKETTTEPEGPDPITEDLFPLTVGRKITYSGMLRHAVADTNITATAAVYETRWTVASNTAPVPIGGTSNQVLDSTRVPTGLPTPPTVWRVTPLFIARTPATGTANFSFLQNIGPLYRRFGIARADSLRWFLLADLSKGVGNEWTAFDSSWTAAAGVVRLEVRAQFKVKESIAVGGQTFTTYRLETVRNVTLGGTAVITRGATATLWLAPNVGPVKMILNADGESPGHFREFKSKSW